MSNYCYYCKHIILGSSDDYSQDRKHFHADCLVSYLQELKDGGGNPLFSKEQAEEYVMEIKNAKKLKSASSKLKQFNRVQIEAKDAGIDCSRVFSYISERYRITVLPQLVRKAVRSICDGTYSQKGERVLFEPINQNILIEMFKYFSNVLLQAHQVRERNGGFKSEELKIVYDLAILVNNYTEYKKVIAQRKSYDTLKKESKESEGIIIETQKIKNLESLTGDDLSAISNSIWDD